MKKCRRKQKRIMVMVVILVLTVGLFAVSAAAVPQAQAAEYGISNPTTDSDGVTTWDCVYFGSYWQSDTNGDGTADENDSKTAIKWRVLSVDGDDAFLLADQNLDCQEYNTSYADVTWETCTLRSWLNGYDSASNAVGTDYSSDNFLGNAFSADEQTAIKTTIVVNDDNPDYSTEGGDDTSDKVYLLSIAEAKNSSYGLNSTYWDDNDNRVTGTTCAKNTAYAKACGGNGDWWLRSPGIGIGYVAYVSANGYVESSGYFVDPSACVVRPALHLNLSSDVWTSAGTVTSAEESSDEVTPTSSSTSSPAPASNNTSVVTPSVSTNKTTVSSKQTTAVTADTSTDTAGKAPSAVTGAKAKAKKKSAALSWKKASGAFGYQIQYALNKKFKSVKTKTTAKTELTVKKLKKGKTYYFRIRAYQKSDGKTVYGKWSAVKKAKVK